jgi:chromosome segregation ATPase
MTRAEIETQLAVLRQELCDLRRAHRVGLALLGKLQQHAEALETRICDLADGIDDLTEMLADLDDRDSADWWKHCGTEN